jgi:hypothetical protein
MNRYINNNENQLKKSSHNNLTSLDYLNYIEKFGFENNCSKVGIKVKNEETKEEKIFILRCKNKFCPICSRIKAQKIKKEIEKITQNFQNPKFLTLTLKTDEDLEKIFKKIKSGFEKFKKNKFIKNRIKKIIGIYEIKKKENNKWYIHLHLIVDGLYLEQKKISEIWKKITGDSFIIYIEKVKNKKDLKNYLSKYITKMPYIYSNLNENDKEILKKVLFKKKIILTYGIFLKIEKKREKKYKLIKIFRVAKYFDKENLKNYFKIIYLDLENKSWVYMILGFI